MQIAISFVILTQKYRLFLLPCVLIGFLIFTPLAELAGHGQTSFTIAFFAVILAAINSAREQISWSLIATAMGIPTLLLWSWRLASEERLLEISANVFSLSLLTFTTIVVLRRILVRHANDFDTLCGAAAVYLLIGLSWASSYELIESVSPSAFRNVSDNPIQGWNQLVYFSLTTLTTLGYGDIIPNNIFARIWSTMEAIAGVLYLAILVARLVAIYRNTKIL